MESLVLPSIFYIHKMDHRNHSPKKSQWMISMDEEKSCFVNAMTSNWNVPAYNCWGLHFENGEVAYIGVTARIEPEVRRLFIAKFVDGNKNDKWHGYPANPVREKEQDIPPELVLDNWLQNQYLRPQTIRKISQGLKCGL